MSASICPACASPIVVGQKVCTRCQCDLSRLTSSEFEASTVTVPPGPPREQERARPFPSQIGDFTILAHIGSGGMGAVYLAYEPAMRREVALKVLDEALPGSSDLVRFEREAWIAGRLSHPNIVRTYSRGVTATSHFIVMEFVEGQSLASYIQEMRALRKGSTGSGSAWRRAHIRHMVEWFIGVGDALAYVHQHGVVHRDIKPLNLLIARASDRLLLTDFGLARDDAASRVTRRGDFMGTIRYMSPEQLLAQRIAVDYRSDLWSLGVSLYEAVTLDLPYTAASEEQYISAVATKEPIPACHRDRAVPRDLETVLMKCLERDPDRRFSSAAELRDDLKRCLSGEPVKARRAGVFSRAVRFSKRHPWTVATLTLAGVVILLMFPLVSQQLGVIRDRSRLRRTLEQIVRADSPPEKIQPDWATLAAMLRENARRDPHGALANLAREAMMRVSAGLGLRELRVGNGYNRLRRDPFYAPPSAPFGLLSRPPVLNLFASRVFDLGIPSHILVQVEASTKTNSWTPIGWMEIVNARSEAREQSSVCSFALPRNDLLPGLNTVSMRVNVSFRDLLATELTTGPATEQPSLLTNCSRRGLEETLERIMRRPVIAKFTKSLTPLTIRLYEKYPEDIPEEIDPNIQHVESDSWFKPTALRVVQISLPERPNGQSRFRIPWGRKMATVGFDCAPTEPIPLAGLIVGMELGGTFTSVPPVSIASHLEWHPRRSTAPLISFSLVVGGGVFGLGSMLEPIRINLDSVFSVLKRPGSKELVVYLEPTSGLSLTQTQANGSFTTALLEFRDLIWLQQLLPDRTEPGVLDLHPARDLALQNYFGRYLGHHDWTLPLNVRTLQSQWMEGPPCAP